MGAIGAVMYAVSNNHVIKSFRGLDDLKKYLSED